MVKHNVSGTTLVEKIHYGLQWAFENGNDVYSGLRSAFFSFFSFFFSQKANDFCSASDIMYDECRHTNAYPEFSTRFNMIRIFKDFRPEHIFKAKMGNFLETQNIKLLNMKFMAKIFAVTASCTPMSTREFSTYHK